MGSIDLVLPMQDGDIAFGHAEAVDVLQVEGSIGSALSTIPVGETLLASGLDGGFEIHGFDGVDVDGAEVVRLLAKDGECQGAHARR